MVLWQYLLFFIINKFKMSESKKNGKVAQVEEKLEKFETKTDEKVDNLVKKV